MSILVQGVMKSTSIGAIFLATGSFTTPSENAPPVAPHPIELKLSETPPPPPADPVAQSVENFRSAFLQRVQTNKQTIFNTCFTRVSAGIRESNVALIRGDKSIRTNISLKTAAPDYSLQPIVVLDLGHGHETPGSSYGYDTGAIRDKVVEARVIDAVATQLKDALTEQGLRVVETRDSLKDGVSLSDAYRFRDQDRTLQWRAELSYELARKFPERPVLFLSLHANSAESSKAKGSEIFYYDGAGAHSESAAFARSINTYYKLPTGGRVMTQDFGVLRCQRAQTPAILVELGYLSNPADRSFLRSALNSESKAGMMAGMIADGVAAYLDKKRDEQRPPVPMMVADLGRSPTL